jgi:hypothetical protein
MTPLSSNPAWKPVLESLRAVFENKPVYLRNRPFFVFVCGGKLGQGKTTLRQQFLQWADHELPNFVCLLAENAIKDNFVAGRRTFIDLARFESVIAGIADCVLIFPESPGSFAETGFFSGSPKIRDKTLVINPNAQQSPSFLNRGPIHKIDGSSLFRPTVHCGASQAADFTPVGQRLRDCLGGTPRHQLEYREFRQLNGKEKLAVVLEILRLLRLADSTTLKHAISVCFGSNPSAQELADLLRILQAGKFVRKDEETPYYRIVGRASLIEIKNVDIDEILASVTLFYQLNSPRLLKALQEVGP